MGFVRGKEGKEEESPHILSAVERVHFNLTSRQTMVGPKEEKAVSGCLELIYARLR